MIVFESIFGIIVVGLCAIFAGLARKHRNEAGQFNKQAHEWAAAAQTALETARSSNKATDDLVTKSLVSMKVLQDRAAEHEAKAKFHEIQSGNRAAAAKVEADQAFKHASLTDQARQEAASDADRASQLANFASREAGKAADFAHSATFNSERAQISLEAVADHDAECRKSVVEAQNHANDAGCFAATAETNATESREHMLAAHKSAQASQTQANISLGHSTISQSAAIDALKHKKEAAEHVAVATRVSVMVRDLAERANVKLVPPGKKYTSTEGSNIHRG